MSGSVGPLNRLGLGILVLSMMLFGRIEAPSPWPDTCTNSEDCAGKAADPANPVIPNSECTGNPLACACKGGFAPNPSGSSGKAVTSCDALAAGELDLGKVCVVTGTVAERCNNTMFVECVGTPLKCTCKMPRVTAPDNVTCEYQKMEKNGTRPGISGGGIVLVRGSAVWTALGLLTLSVAFVT